MVAKSRIKFYFLKRLGQQQHCETSSKKNCPVSQHLNSNICHVKPEEFLQQHCVHGLFVAHWVLFLENINKIK